MGMCIATDGQILALNSRCDNQQELLANGGVYIVEHNTLATCGLNTGDKFSLEDDILVNLLENGKKLYGYDCSGRFIDIGIPHDYFRASEILTSQVP